MRTAGPPHRLFSCLTDCSGDAILRADLGRVSVSFRLHRLREEGENLTALSSGKVVNAENAGALLISISGRQRALPSCGVAGTYI